DSTYIVRGEIKKYKPNAIQKRCSSLAKVERAFNFNIDNLINDKNEVINLLKRIRAQHLEDPAHTPLSNAVRHYYECMTGDKIGKIF
ncbi:MAG: hypothetical protein K2N33_05255, partial [Clostridia bacterium]|nr:hypothetical protein [Clostridia bacterium]